MVYQRFQQELVPNETAKIMDEIRGLMRTLLEMDPKDGMTNLEVIMHKVRVEHSVETYINQPVIKRRLS